MNHSKMKYLNEYP